MTKLQTKVEDKEGEVRQLWTQVEVQDRRIDDIEQYSSSNCLLIHGRLPESRLNLKLPRYAIDRAHRIGRKNSGKKHRPLIVKFISYADRELNWRAKRLLKNTGILITESFTAARTRLLDEVKRKFSKELVWTTDGKIVILGSDDKKHFLTGRDDLEKNYADHE
ncbi:hypothetical protein J437_LFUL018667 [Ladona fulva]|uniref:Uncharacterized protein n=1 Tax=Ladona fulva TaxID=123851 RepID=A0A8K0P7L6_LADFU|nr:hypothetical protein J437_LFUL018667 [Ladona fulva]